MKLGVAYNLFDGEELLEYSIKSIRNNVDFISVLYQELSYHGMKCSDDVLPLLNRLKKEGLIDEFYLFEPNLIDITGDNPQFNETNKRTLGLEISKKNGCTHHMTIDADEFYTYDQFKFMKNEMENGNFDSGAVQHCQYYKDSIYILKNKEGEFVATIEKIYPDTKFVFQANYPVPIDPSRKTNNGSGRVRIFNRGEVEMHHMSFVRKNIKGKLMNHTSRRFFTDELINNVDEHYKNWKFPDKVMWAGGNLLEVIEIPRIFKIYDVL